jgi:hypothetical protein
MQCCRWGFVSSHVSASHSVRYGPVLSLFWLHHIRFDQLHLPTSSHDDTVPSHATTPCHESRRFFNDLYAEQRRASGPDLVGRPPQSRRGGETCAVSAATCLKRAASRQVARRCGTLRCAVVLCSGLLRATRSPQPQSTLPNGRLNYAASQNTNYLGGPTVEQ